MQTVQYTHGCLRGQTHGRPGDLGAQEGLVTVAAVRRRRLLLLPASALARPLHRRTLAPPTGCITCCGTSRRAGGGAAQGLLGRHLEIHLQLQLRPIHLRLRPLPAARTAHICANLRLSCLPYILLALLITLTDGHQRLVPALIRAPHRQSPAPSSLPPPVCQQVARRRRHVITLIIIQAAHGGGGAVGHVEMRAGGDKVRVLQAQLLLSLLPCAASPHTTHEHITKHAQGGGEDTRGGGRTEGQGGREGGRERRGNRRSKGLTRAKPARGDQQPQGTPTGTLPPDPCCLPHLFRLPRLLSQSPSPSPSPSTPPLSAHP